MSLKNKDLAWNAGFFEGEGTVRIVGPSKRDLGHLVDCPSADKLRKKK